MTKEEIVKLALERVQQPTSRIFGHLMPGMAYGGAIGGILGHLAKRYSRAAPLVGLITGGMIGGGVGSTIYDKKKKKYEEVLYGPKRPEIPVHQFGGGLSGGGGVARGF